MADYNTWLVWCRSTAILELELCHVPLKFSEKTVVPVLTMAGVWPHDYLKDTTSMEFEFVECERAVTAPREITRQMGGPHRIIEWEQLWAEPEAPRTTPSIAAGVVAALGGAEFKGSTKTVQGRPRREAIVGLLPGEIALVIRRKDGRMFADGVDEGHDELVAWACAVDEKKKVHVMSRVMAQATADLVREAEIEFEGANNGEKRA